MQVDERVRKLLHLMLIIGDEQLGRMRDKPVISPITGKPLSEYKNLTSNRHLTESNFKLHQQHIDAIMMTIKPGVCSIVC